MADGGLGIVLSPWVSAAYDLILQLNDRSWRHCATGQSLHDTSNLSRQKYTRHWPPVCSHNEGFLAKQEDKTPPLGENELLHRRLMQDWISEDTDFVDAEAIELAQTSVDRGAQVSACASLQQPKLQV